MSNIVTVGATVDGAFKLIGIAPDGSEVLLHDWQDNLILNGGLDAMCYWPRADHSNQQWFRKCVVGTGNSEPEPTQTTLDAFAAASTSSLTARTGYDWDHTETPPYSAWTYFTYNFAVDAVASVSEVGISQLDDGTALVSRIRLEDEEGNPISVPIPSGLALQVIWRLTLYPDTLTEKTGSFTLDSIEYDWQMLPAQVPHLNWPGVVPPSGWAPFANTDSAVGQLYYINPNTATDSFARINDNAASYGDIFGYPASITVATITTDNGYSPGTYFRDFTAFWSSGSGNFSGGVRTMAIFTTCGEWQMLFTPGLPKDNTVSLKITVRITLARHTP